MESDAWELGAGLPPLCPGTVPGMVPGIITGGTHCLVLGVGYHLLFLLAFFFSGATSCLPTSTNSSIFRQGLYLCVCIMILTRMTCPGGICTGVCPSKGPQYVPGTQLVWGPYFLGVGA